MNNNLDWIFVTFCSLFVIGCESANNVITNDDLFDGNYFEPYRKDIIEINNSQSSSSSLVFAAYSDIHSDVENAKRILSFCDYYSEYLDDVICLGDNVVNDYSNDWSWWNKIKGSGLVLNAIGNHDTADYSLGVYSWTKFAGELSYKKFIAPYINDWKVYNPSKKTFYYKDYSNCGIRLIVLDPMCYDSQQEQFLSLALESALLSKLSVVSICHYPVDDIVPFDCGFTLSKFINSKIVTKNWSHEAGINTAPKCVQDYIDKGGTFICWLSGHLHKDAVGVLNKYPDQIAFVFEAATCDSNQCEGSDSTREKGTVNQDSFNVICFNPISKTINVLRIGNQLDINNRSKKQITLDYSNKRIIESY